MKKYILGISFLILLAVLCACQPTTDEAGSLCAHTFGEWNVTRDATCSEQGSRERVCTKCNYTEAAVIYVKEHTLVIDAAVPATCTATGLGEGRHCSVCNKVIIKQSVIPAEHKYDEGTITREKTCKTTGIKTYTCTICGDTKSESTGTLSHKYNDGLITQNPTCVKTGVKTYTCTVCSTTKTETVAKLGHNPNNNNVCTRCGTVCPIELIMTEQEKTNADNVGYISNRQTWHQDENNRHVLVFSFLDASENEISAPAIVEIKIKNDNGELVYSATKTIKSSDFGTWSYSNGAVKKYQASIYINDSEIVGGTCNTGKIYFTVYNTGYFSFSEFTLSISKLPLKATKITLPLLPETLYGYDYNGSINYSLRITNISYEIKGDDLYIYFSGEKTYDSKGANYSRACTVGWKIYDADGYVVETGTFYTPGMFTGEKFKNQLEYAWGVIVPGETYRLEIYNTL